MEHTWIGDSSRTSISRYIGSTGLAGELATPCGRPNLLQLHAAAVTFELLLQGPPGPLLPSATSAAGQGDKGDHYYQAGQGDHYNSYQQGGHSPQQQGLMTPESHDASSVARCQLLHTPMAMAMPRPHHPAAAHSPLVTPKTTPACHPGASCTMMTQPPHLPGHTPAASGHTSVTATPTSSHATAVASAHHGSSSSSTYKSIKRCCHYPLLASLPRQAAADVNQVSLSTYLARDLCACYVCMSVS